MTRGIDKDERVVVDDKEPRLMFCRPAKLACIRGMSMTTAGDAMVNGAVPCHTCFDIEDVNYRFPYMQTTI